MPTIVHFEIPVDNVQRAKDFYTDLFDWKFEKIDAGEFEYWIIVTKDSKGNTGLSGGMIKKSNNYVNMGNYIGVDSVDDYSSKVKELGGKIIVPKTEVPGYGYFAACQDTEGNHFSLWQENKNTK